MREIVEQLQAGGETMWKMNKLGKALLVVVANNLVDVEGIKLDVL